jgi:hypothetical protein
MLYGSHAVLPTTPGMQVITHLMATDDSVVEARFTYEYIPSTYLSGIISSIPNFALLIASLSFSPVSSDFEILYHRFSKITVDFDARLRSVQGTKLTFQDDYKRRKNRPMGNNPKLSSGFCT